MPREKQDNDEVRNLRSRRDLWSRSENLFSAIFVACQTALKDGYIDLDRANNLVAFLEQDTRIASIFPNNILHRMLAGAVSPGAWATNVEIAILDFIAALYLGEHPNQRVGIGVAIQIDGVRPLSVDKDPAHLTPPDHPEFYLDALIKRNPDIFDAIFNASSGEILLNDCFVGFTGAFDGTTRKECFAEVRMRGGVPTDQEYLLDFLFVAEKQYQQRYISGTLSGAITKRRIAGRPLILREAAWRTLTTSS